MKTVEDARAEAKSKLDAIIGEAAPPVDPEAGKGEDPPQPDPPQDPAPPEPPPVEPPAPTPPEKPAAAASPETPGDPPPQVPETPSAPDTPAGETPEFTVKLEKRYADLRRIYNQTESRNKTLEAEVELLKTANTPENLTPLSQATRPQYPAAPPGQPAQPTGETESLAAIKKEMAQEFDEDYIEKHSKLIDAIARERIDELRGSYDPIFDQLANSTQKTEKRTQDQLFLDWDKAVREKVPDYVEVAESDAFTVWIDLHPYGAMFKSSLWPQNGEAGATAKEAAEIFAEFKNQHGQPASGPETPPASPPGNQDPLPANPASEARAAAAAESSQGSIPTSPPAIPGQAPSMMLSEFQKELNEVKNDPAKIRELRIRMDQAIAAGQFYDDTGPRPASY